MELIERFKFIMKLNDLSSSSFADKVGVQRSSVSHILSGRNKPSLEFIQKVLYRFPKVDANWLITGRKDQNRTTEELPDSSNIKQSDSKSNYNSQRKVKKVIILYSDSTFDEIIQDDTD